MVSPNNNLILLLFSSFIYFNICDCNFPIAPLLIPSPLNNKPYEALPSKKSKNPSEFINNCFANIHSLFSSLKLLFIT